jgi:hypothetical protein
MPDEPDHPRGEVRVRVEVAVAGELDAVRRAVDGWSRSSNSILPLNGAQAVNLSV